MLTRTVTGFFFILVLVGAILAGVYTFTALFTLIALFSLLEFYHIINQKQKPNVPVGLLLSISLILGIVQDIFSLDLPGIYYFSYLFVIGLFLLELYRKSDQAFTNIGLSILGIIYTIVPFISFILLGFLAGSFNPWLPLGFLIMLWSNDTGAYLSGKFLGKHKLFERHSPKKTWQGFVGGILLALISAAVIAHYQTLYPLHIWLICAGIIGVFGTYGDLIESMLKRSYGIKDSGKILPGHGGLLDRFDGLLLAAPCVYIFLKFLNYNFF